MTHPYAGEIFFVHEGSNGALENDFSSQVFSREVHSYVDSVLQTPHEASTLSDSGDRYAANDPSFEVVHSNTSEHSILIYGSRKGSLNCRLVYAASVLAVAVIIYQCLRLFISSALVHQGHSHRFLAEGTPHAGPSPLECVVNASSSSGYSDQSTSSGAGGSTALGHSVIWLAGNDGDGSTSPVIGANQISDIGANARRGRRHYHSATGGGASNPMGSDGLRQQSPALGVPEIRRARDRRYAAEMEIRKSSLLLLCCVARLHQASSLDGQPRNHAARTGRPLPLIGEIQPRDVHAGNQDHQSINHQIVYLMGRIYGALLSMEESPLPPRHHPEAAVVRDVATTLRLMQCLLSLSSNSLFPLRMAPDALAYRMILFFLRLSPTTLANFNSSLASSTGEVSNALGSSRRMLNAVLLMGLRGAPLSWSAYLQLVPADSRIASCLVHSETGRRHDAGTGAIFDALQQVVPEIQSNVNDMNKNVEPLQQVPSESPSTGPPLHTLAQTYEWEPSVPFGEGASARGEDQVVPSAT